MHHSGRKGNTPYHAPNGWGRGPPTPHGGRGYGGRSFCLLVVLFLLAGEGGALRLLVLLLVEEGEVFRLLVMPLLLAAEVSSRSLQSLA